VNLSQVIHTRWAADVTLNGLLAASTKVVTGRHFAEDPGTSWAWIEMLGGPYETRMNSEIAVAAVTVRFTVHYAVDGADNHTSCNTACNAIHDVFDNEDFALANSDQVLCMRANGIPVEMQDEETGEWEFTVEYTCRVRLAVGR